MNLSVKSSGFTIVEILVSVTILMLFFGFTYAGYSHFTNRQELINAGQDLKNILRDVQSRAYNNELDCDICDCQLSVENASSQTLVRWSIDLTDRRIFGICRNPANEIVEFSSSPVNIPEEVEITASLTPPASPAVISYYYYPPSSSSAGSISLSKTNLEGIYYLIEINQAGLITDRGIVKTDL